MADKRLFEQPIEIPTSQGMENRIAFGRSGVATKNMTFNNLISWLNSKLSFLKPSSNLNDLQNKATARSNLNVYSKDEVYSKYEVDYSLNTLNNRLGGISIVAVGYCTFDGTYYRYDSLHGIPITFEKVSGDTGKYRITHNLGAWGHQTIAFIDVPADQTTANPQIKIGQISRYENYDHIYTSDDSSRNDLLPGMNIFIMIITY